MSAQEAVERLRGSVRPESMLDVVWGDSSAQLRGLVLPPRVSIQLRPMRRSFDAVFEASIVDLPGGCRVAGALRVPLAAFTIGFVILWTAFAAGWTAIAVVAAMASSGSAALALPFLVLPLGGAWAVIRSVFSRRRAEDALVRRLDDLLGVA